MIYAHGATELAAGDVYLFRGLEDQDVEPGKSLLVTGISLTGQLQFTILNEDGTPRSLHSLPYSDAIELVEQRIWLDHTMDDAYRQEKA